MNLYLKGVTHFYEKIKKTKQYIIIWMHYFITPLFRYIINYNKSFNIFL